MTKYIRTSIQIPVELKSDMDWLCSELEISRAELVRDILLQSIPDFVDMVRKAKVADKPVDPASNALSYALKRLSQFVDKEMSK